MFFILRRVDTSAILATLSQSDARYLPLMMALAFFDRYLMAYKWAMLLRAQGAPISNAEAFRIYIASTFIGTFLPVGIGADIFKLTRTTLGGRRLDTVTASIIMERVLGLLSVMVLAIAALAILVLRHEQQFQQLFAFMCLLLFVFLAILVVTLKVNTFGLLHRYVRRLQRYKIARIMRDIRVEYQLLGQNKTVLTRFFLLSIFEHGVISFINFLGGQALDLAVGPVYFFAIIPVSSLLRNMPISISAIGVQEGVYIMLFSLVGLSATQSLSFSFFMRITSLLLLLLGGFFCLYDTFRATKARS
jgi:glycosyltransferase 2 family protein